MACGETLRSHIGVNFRVSEISLKALEACDSQWGKSNWDWHEIYRNYRDADAFKFAIWVDDTLCGLAVATTSGQSVVLRFVEGSPDVNCPLKGRRILIALEAAANYGQNRGKRELKLEPLNEELISLYESVYGFEVVRQGKGPVFCRKGI
jgi:hypothetical protein